MHYFIAFMYATHIRSHIIPWTVGIRIRNSSNLHACPIAKYSLFCIWTSYMYALQAVEHLNLQKVIAAYVQRMAPGIPACPGLVAFQDGG